MCYERYLRRRPDDAEESLWQDFEQSSPVTDSEAPAEAT